MTEPTDAEIRGLAATGNGVYQDDETAIWEITDPSLMKLVRAALEKWGQPDQAAEPVYAFRRKGFDDFCTCTEKRYAELSAKPNLFETRIFYTAPQPVEREPLTDEQIKDLQDDGVFWGACRQIVRAIEAEHGIKGGQHDR